MMFLVLPRVRFLWQRYAVDLAEIGTPCLDQEFLDFPDPRTCQPYTNCDACSDIDRNLASDSNEYISE